MDFTFADNAEVKDLTGVPENFHSFYEKPDGSETFKLRTGEPAIMAAVGSITGLNTSLKASRAEAGAFKKQRVDISGLSEYGDNPSDIAAAFTAKLAEATKAGGKAPNIEKIKQEIATANAAEMKNRDTRIGALQNQLYGHLVTSQATVAITAEKGIPELLMPLIRDQVSVSEKNGEYVVNVVDKEGDLRFSGVTGLAMTIPELVKEIKSDTRYSRIFESEQQSGSGAPSGQQRGSAGRQAAGGGEGEAKRPIDKIKAGLAARQAGK